MQGIHTAFAGRLGRAPELRTSKAGKPYVTFSLVVTTGADESQWVNCAAFGETADGVAHLAAGTALYVEGTLRLSMYEKRDGTPAASLNVTASLVQPLAQIGRKRRHAPSRAAAASQAPLRASSHDGPNDALPF